MGLPDAMDLAPAYSFSVTIDGVEVPYVMEVSGLKAEVDKVSYQHQASDGKFITRQMMGRQKPGEFKVKRGLTDSTTITDWLTQIMQGDLAGSRKTAAVTVYTSDNTQLKKYNYRNCWTKDVELAGTLKAGYTEPMTENPTLCRDEMEFA